MTEPTILRTNYKKMTLILQGDREIQDSELSTKHKIGFSIILASDFFVM